MSVGSRNRLMIWSGAAIPYKPGKSDLLEATRRTSLVFKAGGVLGIAGEGRIHAREVELLPLNEGAAFFAMRSGVPLVPVAIRGTSWLAFGRRVRVEVGGAGPSQRPPEPRGRRGRHPGHLAGAPRPRRRRSRAPGPGTLLGRWLTELSNEWPEGSREATLAATAGGRIRMAPLRDPGEIEG